MSGEFDIGQLESQDSKKTLELAQELATKLRELGQKPVEAYQGNEMKNTSETIGWNESSMSDQLIEALFAESEERLTLRQGGFLMLLDLLTGQNRNLVLLPETHLNTKEDARNFLHSLLNNDVALVDPNGDYWILKVIGEKRELVRLPMQSFVRFNLGSSKIIEEGKNRLALEVVGIELEALVVNKDDNGRENLADLSNYKTRINELLQKFGATLHIPPEALASTIELPFDPVELDGQNPKGIIDRYRTVIQLFEELLNSVHKDMGNTGEVSIKFLSYVPEEFVDQIQVTDDPYVSKVAVLYYLLKRKKEFTKIIDLLSSGKIDKDLEQIALKELKKFTPHGLHMTVKIPGGAHLAYQIAQIMSSPISVYVPNHLVQPGPYDERTLIRYGKDASVPKDFDASVPEDFIDSVLGTSEHPNGINFFPHFLELLALKYGMRSSTRLCLGYGEEEGGEGKYLHVADHGAVRVKVISDKLVLLERMALPTTEHFPTIQAEKLQFALMAKVLELISQDPRLFDNQKELSLTELLKKRIVALNTNLSDDEFFLMFKTDPEKTREVTNALARGDSEARNKFQMLYARRLEIILKIAEHYEILNDNNNISNKHLLEAYQAFLRGEQSVSDTDVQVYLNLFVE